MKPNLKLGNFEVAATIGCISLIPIILTIPTLALESFGTAAFLHNVYTAILTIIILSIIFILYKNFANMDIIDLCNFVGGRTLQIIGGIIIILYLLTLSILTFAEFTQNVQNVIFTNAPQEYISILFGIVMILSAWLGLQGIFRTGSIIAPIIIFGFFLMFFSLWKDVDITNFTPIFGNSISYFWKQGPWRIGRYEGVFLILLIIPYIKNYKKAGVFSFIIATLIILPTLFLLIGIIPYPSILENHMPIFELTRLISFGRFIQRVESIFILLWLLATFIYLSLGLSFSSLVFQKIFKLKYNNRLIPAFTGIIVSSSIILNTFEFENQIRNFVFLKVAPFIIYIIPIILLLIATIKRRHQCKKLILQNSSS